MKKFLVGLGIIVLLIFFSPPGLLILYSYMFQAVYEDTSSSKLNVGSVFFYQEASFLDTTVTIFVRDHSLSGSEPIELGLVDEGGPGGFPEKTVWSKDGMVLAVREHGRWTYVYDFQQHTRYSIPGRRKEDSDSSAVQRLLDAHGGEGKKVRSQDELSARLPWPWEHH